MTRRHNIIWEIHGLNEHLVQIRQDRERLVAEEQRVLRHVADLREELRSVHED